MGVPPSSTDDSRGRRAGDGNAPSTCPQSTEADRIIERAGPADVCGYRIDAQVPSGTQRELVASCTLRSVLPCSHTGRVVHRSPAFRPLISSSQCPANPRWDRLCLEQPRSLPDHMLRPSWRPTVSVSAERSRTLRTASFPSPCRAKHSTPPLPRRSVCSARSLAQLQFGVRVHDVSYVVFEREAREFISYFFLILP